MTHGIGPALVQQTLITLAALGLQQGILEPGTRVIDIEVGGNHIVVTGQHHWMLAALQRMRVLDQALEPGQFVIELRPRLRIAVGQV
ncbi:hypothetical protein D3C80_1849930 [compost metagenome]